MIASAFLLAVGVFLLWLGSDVRRSERAALNIYQSAGIAATLDPVALGKYNGPMDGVLLDRGLRLRKNSAGKFDIIPTAKFNTEYQ